MPQLQPGAVRAALKAALALRCTVAPHLVFDRKHYFYADLPAGYQITQKRSASTSERISHSPVCTRGHHRDPL